MPYSKAQKKAYNAGYWAGAHYMALLMICRNKYGLKKPRCPECGNDSVRQLEIHHKNRLLRQSRDYADLCDFREVEVRCRTCHEDTEGYKGH